VSLGYYYASLEGRDALNQTGPPPMIQYWQSPPVTLSTESQILSASSLFRPLPSLSFGLDTQFEWTHEVGFGEVENTFGSPAAPFLAPLALEDNSNLDEFKSMQNAAVRFTKIPWTVLFADARFEQDSNRSSQEGAVDGSGTFVSKIDADNTEYDVRSGSTT